MIQFPKFKALQEPGWLGDINNRHDYLLCPHINMATQINDDRIKISISMSYKNGCIYTKIIPLFCFEIMNNANAYRQAKNYIKTEISDICYVFTEIKQTIRETE